MTLLGGGTLAGLQRLALGGMPDVFDLYRPVLVQDDEGALSAADWTHLAGGPCQLITLASGQQEQPIGQRLQQVQPAAVLLPYGTPVQLADILIVGAQTFEVVGIAPEGAYNAAVSVTLERRT